MNMTHYMQLLADNQPWNLMIFMAIPIVLAETLAITELYVLYTRRLDGPVYLVNRLAGAVVGVYFVGLLFTCSQPPLYLSPKPKNGAQ